MSFVDFASSQGLLIKHLYSDGRIHRCGTVKHPRSTNGAYMFDGKSGWCMRWGVTDPTWWNDPHAKPLTDHDKKAWNKKRIEDANRIHQKHLKASREASEKLSVCAIDTHPYLIKKKLPEVTGLVDSEGFLYVPMRDYQTNELNGAQIIKWDCEEKSFVKKFIPGMKAKGSVFRIGKGAQTILTEGYATALSVYQAVRRLNMNASVVCCFSASNMVHVGGIGHFVMADNDQSRTGEEAAIKTGLPWMMPDQVNTDWNDVHAKHGIIPICKALTELMKNVYKQNKTM